ncbi:DUF2585 family protein [Anaerolineales bacterium HSG24]|nr:DUF2585 family protein [Anaerolineales bacterium HSG24]
MKNHKLNLKSPFIPTRQAIVPWLTIFSTILLAVFLLRSQGRLWWCSCNRIYFWAGDIWSSDNSQHLFDPYSFTHMLHGVLFCGLLVWLSPWLSPMWRLCVATFLEATWEVFENTEAVIERYRESTAALGYEGDSIVNSMGDIFICGVGFIIAFHLGLRRSIILFAVTELILLFWIRDSLLLNSLMLLYPIESVIKWQMEGGGF